MTAPAPPPRQDGPPLAALLQSASARLATALGLARDEARLEARILATRALGVNRAWLAAHGDAELTAAQAAALSALIARREGGEPVAYILGEREFYGRAFLTTPDVLIPRPETEGLIEAALELGDARGGADAALRVLDIGAGSGCIAITLALLRPHWRVTGVDVSTAALAVARANAERHGARVDWRPGDLFDALDGARFDLILSNPPYVADDDPARVRGDTRFEPPVALFSGADGLDCLRRLIAAAPAHLAPGGWLLCEHGADQAAAVRETMTLAGLATPTSRPDLAGHERITLARQGESA